MNCSKCGKDTGTEGVTTVEITVLEDGRRVPTYYRECRECALEEARKESSSGDVENANRD